MLEKHFAFHQKKELLIFQHDHKPFVQLGSGFLGAALALQVVETWLNTDWGAERHGRRVEKITAIERSYTGAPGGKDR